MLEKSWAQKSKTTVIVSSELEDHLTSGLIRELPAQGFQVGFGVETVS